MQPADQLHKCRFKAGLQTTNELGMWCVCTTSAAQSDAAGSVPAKFALFLAGMELVIVKWLGHIVAAAA